MHRISEEKKGREGGGVKLIRRPELDEQGPEQTKKNGGIGSAKTTEMQKNMMGHPRRTYRS